MIANTPDHNERLRVARRIARWHIGDNTWADTIIDAYLNPQDAETRLEHDIADNE